MQRRHAIDRYLSSAGSRRRIFQSRCLALQHHYSTCAYHALRRLYFGMQLQFGPTVKHSTERYRVTVNTRRVKWIVRFAWCVLAALPLAARADDIVAAQMTEALTALPADLPPTIRTNLTALYERLNYRPLWLNVDAAATPQATALLRTLAMADMAGLDPRDYKAAELSERVASLAGATAKTQIAAVDVAISAMGELYAHHLHYGRIDPRAAGFDMPVRSTTLDAGELLERIATQGTTGVFETIEPPFQHYRALKEVLVHYRQLAQQPQISVLPAVRTPSAKPGLHYDGTPQLRALLVALGDMPVTAAGADDTLLDDAIVAALKQFQFRHGLQQDGALGKATYAALIRPLAERARQIELTLERFRWLPAGDVPTIFVNIPQFRLFAFESTGDHEANMLTMNVIVGKTFPGTQTPVFAGDMKYLIFRPYWDVPYSIMKGELLPRIRRDPGYVEAQNMEIVNSDSDRAAAVPATAQNIDLLASGKYRIRQRPGDENALGLVKFMLPNRYNVYLHSTPAKQLFQQSRRAFSHGCIRVSDPVALAQYVLKNGASEWPREKIFAAMEQGDSQRVNLAQRIRVLIVYGTAVATEAGRVYFFDDIYGNDARLAALLAKR